MEINEMLLELYNPKVLMYMKLQNFCGMYFETPKTFDKDVLLNDYLKKFEIHNYKNFEYNVCDFFMLHNYPNSVSGVSISLINGIVDVYYDSELLLNFFEISKKVLDE